MARHPAAPLIQTDRPALGLALMAGFCVTAPMADSLSKIAAAVFPVLQLVAIRFAVQVVVLIPLVWATQRSFAMSRRGWMLTGLRSVLQIAGIFLMVTGLRYLPLADAIAIAFVMPFILLLLGHLYFGEVVGMRRLAACAVGFAGTLLVMQPSFAEVGWPVLYPLSVAVVFALFILVTRSLGKAAEPIAMQANSGVIALSLLAVVYLLAPDLPLFELHAPGLWWPLLLAMGIMGMAGHLLMTWSLSYAPAATTAPMQYLEIPVAALLGLLVFGDWPDGLALLGIAIIMASGLYILWREARA